MSKIMIDPMVINGYRSNGEAIMIPNPKYQPPQDSKDYRFHAEGYFYK